MKAILIILDGVGCGELPDAGLYGDEGSNSLANTAKALGGLEVPFLTKLGLGNILPLEGISPVETPLASYGRMAELSPGKDTTTGHWEMMGIVLQKPFPTYPQGFPQDLITRVEKAWGRKVIGNRPASGTQIIQELGERHLKTGEVIVYTSADSVFQVAAHEEVIPLEELYHLCLKARQILQGDHGVARVIARPFKGELGSFFRTPHRKDFSLPPPEKTILDVLLSRGFVVQGIGKIDQVFAQRGITSSEHVTSNREGLEAILRHILKAEAHFIFANLVDFDMVFGHRNNVEGYARALEEFDQYLPRIVDALGSDDLLFITADHGNDPTTPSTDHSREYVPLLVVHQGAVEGYPLGTRETFADLGATLSDFFELEPPRVGTSFLALVAPPLGPLVAIDGPAGSGKSTVAKEVARRLAFTYLDTGAMYRALTLKAIRKGLAIDDERALSQMAQETSLELFETGEGVRVIMDDEDVSEEIRTEPVEKRVSPVSACPGVRKVMVSLQQRLGRKGRMVVEGRDIGTCVFPQSPYKFFLTASLEQRALRIQKDLKRKGLSKDTEALKEEILRRDERDKNRPMGPLRVARDAHVIDSSSMSVEEAVEAILRWLK